MLSDCPSRYLTADGRIMRCDAIHSSIDSGAGLSIDCHSDGTTGFPWWDDSDPCSWEAPDCQRGECEDGQVPIVTKREAGADYHAPCPTCDGTGVDESIPLRLVGVGSVLRYNDRLEDCCSEVLRLVTKVGRRPQKDRERFPSSAPPVSTQCASCGSWRVLLPHDIGPGRPWTVFRAVPPMHCNEMLKEKNQ